MSKTAIIALLAELNDVDGEIFARMQDRMPAALRDAEIVPPSVVRSALRRGDADAVFAIAGNLGLPSGRIAELYDGPALATLRALRALAPRNPYAYRESTRGLGELMERHLGGSVTAWARLIASLPDATGSLPEVIAAAGAGVNTPPIAVPENVRVDVPTNVPTNMRVDVRQLLLLAPPERLAELVPALRPETVRDLVRFGARLPAGVLADVVESATSAQRRTLAKARWARPEVGAALIALGDPEVDAAVYLNPRTGLAIRARIMASATPLHASLVARVCGDWATSIRVPALWSGDPLLVRSALLKREAMTITLAECLTIWQDKGVDGLRPHARTLMSQSDGHAPQPFRLPRYRSLFLITLLRLYERAGARAALDLLDESTLDPKLARRCRELLSTPEGVDRLRVEIASCTGTRRLARRLRGFVPRFGWPHLETTCVDWDELRKIHRRRPFTEGALALLSEQDGCPPELTREAEAVAPLTGAARRGRWPEPVTWHDGRPHRHRPAAQREIAASVAAGRTPVEDVLTDLRAVLGAELLGMRDTVAPDTRAAAELSQRLRHLTATRLGGEDRDGTAAGVVALRLLPDFQGSLAELLATAGAAARP